MRTLTPEDLLRLREVEDPRIHPDASSVVFVRMEMDGKANRYRRSLWIAPLPKGRPRRLTWGGRGGEWSPRWSPRGDRLAFVSDRSGVPQLYVIDPSGGEARPLTRLRSGVSSPAWSPDGGSLAFLCRVDEDEARDVARGRGTLSEGEKPPEPEPPDPRVVERILYRSGTEYFDGRRSHVYVVRAGRPGRPRRVSSGPFDHGPPLFGPRGRFLYTTSNRTGDEDQDEVRNIVRFPAAGGKARILTPAPDHCADLRLSPDGRHLVYFAMPGEKFYAHNQTARRLPLSGKGGEEVLSSELDADVEAVACLPSTGEVLALACRDGDRRVYRLPGPGRPAVPLTPEGGWVESFSVARRTDDMALAFARPVHPPDLFHLPPGGPLRRRTQVNRSFLRSVELSEPETLRFEGEGGLPVQGWYMPPVPRPRGRAPLVVQIHGGPHVMWGRSFSFEFQLLASQGFGVFFCNPRGSAGYGLSFKGMLRRNWGVDDAGDVLRGMEAVLARGRTDDRRLFVTGGSYGGFLTAWILGQDDRFRAAVVQRGVYDMTPFYGCSDVQMLLEWEFEARPWEDPDLYWKHSPLRRVERMRTPLLILHAERDYRAPISTAEELFVALRKLGREASFVRYPREGHELSRSGEPRHRVDRLRRILGWFRDRM